MTSSGYIYSREELTNNFFYIVLFPQVEYSSLMLILESHFSVSKQAKMRYSHD